MFLRAFGTLIFTIFVASFAGQTILNGNAIGPCHEAVYLEIATIISDMEHDFLRDEVFPIIGPHVHALPAGVIVELTAPEDVSGVLRHFSSHDWVALFSYLNEDDLAHIIQLFEALALQVSEMSITIDGVAVDFEGQSPTFVDGHVLVPVRGVFEALDFAVLWHGEAQRIILIRGSTNVIIFVDEDTFFVNGVAHKLDVPAQIIEGRTLLPIRPVLESIGYYMDWDSRSNAVVIKPMPLEGSGDYITIRGARYSMSLTRLDLSNMELQNEDIVPLQYMENLTTLNLTYNQISDITPIAGLTNLTELRLGSNQISDLTPLSNLTNLTILVLNWNQASDLTPLSGLINLERLNLGGGNQISDIMPLTGLVNLNTLSLQSNQISNIGPLADLVNLSVLSLQSNQISDIAPLTGLVNLVELRLGGNQINDLSPLANLTNVERLMLWRNEINNITALENLVNLIVVNLSINPITDWSPVEHVPNVFTNQ